MPRLYSAKSAFMSIGIAIPFMFCSLYLYWTFAPVHVLTINKMSVLETEVKSGGELLLVIDYCKNPDYADTQASVLFSFIGKVNYNMPGASSGPLLPGCHVQSELISIPLLPDGTYHIEMLRAYRLNVVSMATIRAESNDFNVVNPPSVPVQQVQIDLQRIQQLLLLTREQLISNNSLLKHNIQLETEVKALNEGNETLIRQLNEALKRRK